MDGYGISNDIGEAIDLYYSIRDRKARERMNAINEKIAQNKLNDENAMKTGLTNAYYNSAQTKPSEVPGQDYSFAPITADDYAMGNAPANPQASLRDITGIDQGKYFNNASQEMVKAGRPDLAVQYSQQGKIIKDQATKDIAKNALAAIALGDWQTANKHVAELGMNGTLSPAKDDKGNAIPGEIQFTPKGGEPAYLNNRSLGEALGIYPNKEQTPIHVGPGTVYDPNTGAFKQASPEQMKILDNRNSIGGSTSANVQWAQYLTEAFGGGAEGQRKALQFIKSSNSNPADMKARLFKVLTERDNATYTSRTSDEVMKEVDAVYARMNGDQSSPGAGAGGLTQVPPPQPNPGAGNPGMPVVGQSYYGRKYLGGDVHAQSSWGPREDVVPQDQTKPTGLSASQLRPMSEIQAEQAANSPAGKQEQVMRDIALSPTERRAQTNAMGQRFGITAGASNTQRGQDYNNLAKSYGDSINQINHGILPDKQKLLDAIQFAQGKGDQAMADKLQSTLDKYYGKQQ